jgi:hypothetical protein
MTAPPVWKRGFASLSAVLVVVIVAGSAHAEVVFRKKAPPAEGAEASPSGGDSATEGAPPAAEGEAASAAPSASQESDKDFPEAQAQRDKARADAALQRQMKNAELAKQKDQGTPFYQKWEFWAIAGGVAVGAVLLFIGGSALLHQMNGGDVRACNAMSFGMNCFGEGR